MPVRYLALVTLALFSLAALGETAVPAPGNALQGIGIAVTNPIVPIAPLPGMGILLTGAYCNDPDAAFAKMKTALSGTYEEREWAQQALIDLLLSCPLDCARFVGYLGQIRALAAGPNPDTAFRAGIVVSTVEGKIIVEQIPSQDWVAYHAALVAQLKSAIEQIYAGPYVPILARIVGGFPANAGELSDEDLETATKPVIENAMRNPPTPGLLPSGFKATKGTSVGESFEARGQQVMGVLLLFALGGSSSARVYFDNGAPSLTNIPLVDAMQAPASSRLACYRATYPGFGRKLNDQPFLAYSVGVTLDANGATALDANLLQDTPRDVARALPAVFPEAADAIRQALGL